MRYLNFKKEEKGFDPFVLTRENIRKNIGRTVVFVDKRDVCPHRGYYSVTVGVLHSVRYSTLYLDDLNKQADLRDILECGIKKEDQ